MSGSYMQCSECGKRALSIATRCPGCGREFPSKPERHKGLSLDFGRYLPPVAVVAALAAGAALITASLDRPVRPPAPMEEETSSVAAAPHVDPAPLPPPAAPAASNLRVAQTWTKVRTGRSTRADLAAVLLPGDTVAVDSLSHGWYRVALEGEVLGYSHESTLGAGATGPKP